MPHFNKKTSKNTKKQQQNPAVEIVGKFSFSSISTFWSVQFIDPQVRRAKWRGGGKRGSQISQGVTPQVWRGGNMVVWRREGEKPEIGEGGGVRWQFRQG